MKFCKRYKEYMEGRREKELPRVGLKKLKKTLKRCRREFQSQQHQLPSQKEEGNPGVNCVVPFDATECPDQCPVCEGTFFPSLLMEMSTIVGCFNEQARNLLELHLASGFQKYFIWLKSKTRTNHGVLMEDGKDLVTYAIINSIAMRKIVKKYDKIHYSKQGQVFISQAQRMHIEILQSPWLCQLMAFYINLRHSKVNEKAGPRLLADCSLVFDDDKPSLSCSLFDSVKIDVDLTCSICLLYVGNGVRSRLSWLWAYLLLYVLLFCCISDDHHWTKGRQF